MRCRPLLATLVFGGALLTLTTAENSTTADLAKPAISEVEALNYRVSDKIEAGQRTAHSLATELAAYDELFAKYKEKDREEAARALLHKALLFVSVLKDVDSAQPLFEKLKAGFYGTQAAIMADSYVTATQTQTRLIGKPAPELHFTWTSQLEDQRAKKLSDIKQKVILLDFWQTGCSPCVASFPLIRELATHYKGCDVEIIGVTSIQGSIIGLSSACINTTGNPDKEMSLMSDYIKAKAITWMIAFSKESVFNPDYGVFGIPSMVIIAPDGTVRHVDIHPANPEAELRGKIDALLQEFRLKLPAAPPKS